MTKAKDLVGAKYARLTVVSRNHDTRENCREAYWNCLCDCGNASMIVVRTASLTTGQTKSCGCFQKEQSSKASTTHGMSNTSEYCIWAGIIARCCNPSNNAYPRYGGRGIVVCERWRNSFENFYTDMGPRPTPEHSIDRVNNDGNYEPGNCRWATDIEQANNKRTNVIVGESGLTLAQIADGSSIGYKNIHQRLSRGMCLEDALSTELREAKKYTHDGETLTLSEWSDKLGIQVTTLEYGLNKGWEFSKVFGEPVNKVRKYSVRGGDYTISELSETFKIPAWKLYQRMGRDGMTAEEAVSKP